MCVGFFFLLTMEKKQVVAVHSLLQNNNDELPPQSVLSARTFGYTLSCGGQKVQSMMIHSLCHTLCVETVFVKSDFVREELGKLSSADHNCI